MPTDYSQVFNQQVAEDRQRKQAFSDEYRKKQIADYQGFAQHIQGILTSGQVLDKATGNMRPLTDEEKGKLQSTAQTVNQYIQNLYNPQFDPSKGQLSEDPLHKLTDKMRLTKPPQQPTGQAPQTMEQARQGVEAQFGGDTGEAVKRQESERDLQQMLSLIDKYAPPEQRETIKRSLIEKKLGGSPTTKPSLKQYRIKNPDGTFTYGWADANTGELPEGAEWIGPKETSTTPKVGSFGDFLTQAYGPHPTAAQYEEGKRLWAQSGAATTVGTHFIQVPQPDGTIKAYQVTTTSSKQFPGVPQAGAPAAGKGKAAGGKSTAKGGLVSGGETIGGRKTAVVQKAEKDYTDAVELSSIADQVADKPDDAINQKRLAVALERASAGRFTTQALDYVMKAGWGNTLEQWANNPSTGALPSDIMRQLVDGAHQLKQARFDKLQEAKKLSGESSSTGDTTDDDIIKALKKK